MTQAIDRARKSVDRFIPLLKQPEFESWAINVRLVEGNVTEHFWLKRITWSNGQFYGFVASVPKHLKNVAQGQPYSIAQDQIADWMAVKDGRLFGGETIRLLRSRLSPAEKNAFDAARGFRDVDGIDRSFLDQN